MKTIKDLQEILDAEVSKNKTKTKGASWIISKPTTKTKDLRQAIRYLTDCKPSEELIRKQLEQVERKLVIIEERKDGYIKDNKTWLITNGYPELKDMEDFYYRENDRQHLRKQVEMLKLILD